LKTEDATAYNMGFASGGGTGGVECVVQNAFAVS